MEYVAGSRAAIGLDAGRLPHKRRQRLVDTQRWGGFSLYKQVIEQMAKMHVLLSQLRFETTGHVRPNDGVYQTVNGAEPRGSEPLDNARTWFNRWGQSVGEPGDATRESVARSVPPGFARAAVHDYVTFPLHAGSLMQCIDLWPGPFPILHPDLGPNNVLIDLHCNIVGVLGWEKAFVGPWELAAPSPELGLQQPRLFRLPEGQTESESLFHLYMAKVRETEAESGDSKLSAVLDDRVKQHFAAAFWLRKRGWVASPYQNILGPLRHRAEHPPEDPVAEFEALRRRGIVPRTATLSLGEDTPQQPPIPLPSSAAPFTTRLSVDEVDEDTDLPMAGDDRHADATTVESDGEATLVEGEAEHGPSGAEDEEDEHGAGVEPEDEDAAGVLESEDEEAPEPADEYWTAAYQERLRRRRTDYIRRRQEALRNLLIGQQEFLQGRARRMEWEWMASREQVNRVALSLRSTQNGLRMLAGSR